MLSLLTYAVQAPSVTSFASVDEDADSVDDIKYDATGTMTRMQPPWIVSRRDRYDVDEDTSGR